MAALGARFSEPLERGLYALRRKVGQVATRTPYAIYRELDLGPGGYALAPSTQAKRGVRTVLEKKLRRR